MRHAHVANPNDTRLCDNGTRYEFCDCGAVRRVGRNFDEGWHACRLCVFNLHEFELHERGVMIYGDSRAGACASSA